MATFKFAVNGEPFAVEAASQAEAIGKARLQVAKQRMTSTATAGAVARSPAPIPEGSPTEQLAQARLGAAEKMPAASAGLGLAATGALIAPAMAPKAALDMAIYGAAEVAERKLGLPWWVGEAVGLVSPGKKLLQMAERKVLGGVAEREAAKAAERAAARQLKERQLAIAEERNSLLRMRLEGRAPTKATPTMPKPVARGHQHGARRATAAEPEMIPDEAVTAIPEPAPMTTAVAPTGQRAMPTNLGGKAKPGPAPTAPEDIEATLRKSLDAIASKKVAAAVQRESALKAPRIQVGAQRVGRAIGMTKEEVRRQAGPVLGETLGEASPILPKEPLRKIIDTMRAIPMGEREAYVARATSDKARWQVENIRRTLEHLGLLLPVGIAAGEARAR